MILLFIVLLAVVLVMGAGIVFMARGGEGNKKYANRLMQARVLLQGVAVILLAVLFMGKGA